ncbi:hypothetical protein [Halobellus limi]|nr:hypothetical protein [Halobellus limi]
MADFDAVEIVVEIINRADDELDKIDRKFQELKAKHSNLDFNLDINDGGSIARTNHRLNHLARGRVAPIYAMYMGGNVPDFGDLGGGGGGSGPPALPGRSVPALPPAPEIPALMGDTAPLSFRERVAATRWYVGQMRGQSRSFVQSIFRMARVDGEMDRIFAKSLIPSYHQLVTIIAALVPMLIALAVQAFGVAAAFAAVGVAGAGMFGLGLLGQADTLEGSLARSRQLLGEFRDELYATFRPAATLFAPISESALASGATFFQPLADASRNLIVFEDSAASAFRGLIEWAAAALVAMAEYEPMIERLASTFGGPVGNAIIDFFRFITTEAYENQDLLMRLGSAFVMILGIIYNASALIARLVTAFNPVIQVIAYIIDLLNSRWGAAFKKTAIAALSLQGVLIGLSTAAAFLSGLVGNISGLALAFGAATGAAAFFATTAPTSPQYNDAVGPTGLSGSGTTVNNTVVVQGDVSQKHIREWEMMWDDKYGEEQSFESGMSGTSF